VCCGTPDAGCRAGDDGAGQAGVHRRYSITALRADPVHCEEVAGVAERV
jgi:hypothetical protein